MRGRAARGRGGCARSGVCACEARGRLGPTKEGKGVIGVGRGVKAQRAGGLVGKGGP